MTVYIDSEYKCHTAPGDGLREVESPFFDGKCRRFIEGYRFVPTGESWTREDGVEFNGEMIAPFIDYAILQAYQEQYEEIQAELVERDEALSVVGVTV
jgi:hypothetical protein